jgi:hypothetical protein
MAGATASFTISKAGGVTCPPRDSSSSPIFTAPPASRSNSSRGSPASGANRPTPITTNEGSIIPPQILSTRRAHAPLVRLRLESRDVIEREIEDQLRRPSAMAR